MIHPHTYYHITANPSERNFIALQNAIKFEIASLNRFSRFNFSFISAGNFPYPNILTSEEQHYFVCYDKFGEINDEPVSGRCRYVYKNGSALSVYQAEL